MDANSKGAIARADPEYFIRSGVQATPKILFYRGGPFTEFLLEQTIEPADLIWVQSVCKAYESAMS